MDFTLYYRSDWYPAILKYGLLDASSNATGEWRDCEMTPLEKERPWLRGWHVVTIPNVVHGIDFVCCDFLRQYWDNPPADPLGSCSRRNYTFLTPKEGERAVKASLRDGKLRHVAGKPVALVTDLDGTLLGDSNALATFNDEWLSSHLWRGSLLVYNTGRNLKDFLTVAHDQNLIRPDYAVCGVGTEIYTFDTPKRPLSELTMQSTHSELTRSTAGGSTVPPLSEEEKSRNSHIPAWLKTQQERLAGRGSNNRGNETDTETEALDAWDGEVITVEMVDEKKQDGDLRCPWWCPTRYHARLDRQWMLEVTQACSRDEILKRLQGAAKAGEEKAREGHKGEVSVPQFSINGNSYHDPFRISLSITTETLFPPSLLSAAKNAIASLRTYDENNEGSSSHPQSDASSLADFLADHPLSLMGLVRTFSDCILLISGADTWKYLDILPKNAGKLNALAYIAFRRHKLKPEDVLACGDSGNDIDMFCHPCVPACAVQNAQEDFVNALKGVYVGNELHLTPKDAQTFLARARELKTSSNVSHISLLCCISL